MFKEKMGTREPYMEFDFIVKGFLGITVFLGPYLIDYWYTPGQKRGRVPFSRFLDTLQQADIMQDIPESTDEINDKYFS